MDERHIEKGRFLDSLIGRVLPRAKRVASKNRSRVGEDRDLKACPSKFRLSAKFPLGKDMHRSRWVSEGVRWASVGTLVCLAFFFTACEPQGPKALLEGERLLQQDRPEEALRLFKLATDKMPREARAWNFLGLAYHATGELAEAGQAYQKALALNHRLSDARFNLGSLLLEQDQPMLAINELTAYTLVQGRDLNGWLKLAAAQMRLNRMDAAEVSYRTALTLTSKNAEAFNGLGMIQVGKRRYVEGIQYFQAALAETPGYPPALLNQAIVTHRNLNQKATALQKYKQYLALQPRPDNWDSVNAIAQSLGDELGGAGRGGISIQTNQWVSRAGASLLVHSNLVTAPRGFPVTNALSVAKPATAPAVAQAAATPPVSAPPVVSPSPTAILPPANLPRTLAANVTTPPRPPAETPKAVREAESPPPLAITEVTPEISVRPAQDIVKPVEPTSPPRTRNSSAPLGVGASPAVESRAVPTPPRPVAKDERPSFLARMNPFRNRSRSEPPVPSSVSVGGSSASSPAAAATVTAPASEGTFKRYAYRQPGRPQVGDRQKSSDLVHKGVLAHQDRRPEEELAYYRSASLVDPSSFDAFFNLGMASGEHGDWETSLSSYEQALAIDSDSVSARFNFASALRQTDYIVDSAREFETILQTHPGDTRTLLSLGNLYAQRLKQPRTARQYYLRMLEADPNHPKAPEVRFWLAANP